MIVIITTIITSNNSNKIISMIGILTTIKDFDGKKSKANSS